MALRIKALLVVVAALSVLQPLRAMAKEYVFPAMSLGTVVADIPAGWSGTAPPVTLPEATASRFAPESSQDQVVLVTVMRVVSDSPFADSSREGIEALVADSARKAAPTSGAAAPKVESFASGQVHGAYFSAADPEAPAGEYKYMTQGVASFGKLAVTFTALSHTTPEASRDALLAIVKSLRLLEGGAASR